MSPFVKYSVPRVLAASLACVLAGVSGCGSSGAGDARTVSGALSTLADSAAAHDSARLFRVIDQRARHAMASIATDRKACAAIIKADYPPNERESALKALGDATDVKDAAGLFARRCDASCMDALGAQLGAPAKTTQGEGEQASELVVETARGTTLHMHLGNDGHYGLVWNTEALMAERDRASHEALQIRANAEVYRRRRALEAAP